ncbi:DUF697 domain-containing protein [Neolewinella agarilytica]|uniref:Uncharacterized conserved protein, DUF697 family n=1 Tax=Neolewinella agarilytica TaxID=478744 RepID=A0A1H9LAZ0_9BACT|nr:DUF697 domain-containing protein [Neolewinella agarilytica]SER08379.1 Uncharacterized conserved protein, DUF697 family [Neolewinella agarilytica]
MRKKITDFAKKQLKDSIMNPNSNNDKNRHAETVIRNHVIWSMGASYIIPLPIADVFAVSALQLDMIRQLCRVYDIDFAETQGKAIVSALTTSTMARAGARSLLKVIPVVGTVVGGITVAVVNGASTYALGEVFKKHFSNGGTFLDFDTDRLKKLYKEKFEKGKKVAQEWKEEVATEEDFSAAAPEPTPEAAPTKIKAKTKKKEEPAPEPEPAAAVMDDDAIRKIKELAEMKAQNIITEEEFEAMKKRIIG